MKIIEVIKECRARNKQLWNPISGYKNGVDHGLGLAYSRCADMLEETVSEIREEIAKLEDDKKNDKLVVSANAMILILNWVLRE